MPPTIQDLHPIDPILSRVSVDYKNIGFVSDIIFPVVQVAEISGTYPIYDKRNRFALPDTRRAPKSPYNKVSWGMSWDTYKCEDWGLEEIIDDKEKKISKNQLNLTIDTTEIVTDLVMLAREKRVIDIVTDNTVITNTTNLTGTNRWNDYSNSDPITVIEAGKIAISDAIGREPNTLILGKDVWDKLKWHPALTSKIQYVKEAVLTKQIVAALLGFDRVEIAASQYASSKKGQTTTLARLFGKNALICYVEPAPGIKKISLGYVMEYEARTVKPPYRDKDNIGDVIRVTEYTDEKLVAADCGYLITNAVD